MVGEFLIRVESASHTSSWPLIFSFLSWDVTSYPHHSMITVYPKGKPHTSLYLLAQNVRIKQSHWTLLKSWGWEQENKVWASEWGWSEVPGGLLSRAFRPYLMQLSLCQCTGCHLSTHNLESTPEQWLSSRCQHPEPVFLIKIMLPLLYTTG